MEIALCAAGVVIGCIGYGMLVISVKFLDQTILLLNSSKQQEENMARVVATKDSKDNLCKYCQHHFSTCPKAYHIKFGDGVGGDNVVECSEFISKSMWANFPIEGKPEYGVIRGSFRDDSATVRGRE